MEQVVTLNGETLPLGWLRDLPDFRDRTPEHDAIRPMMKTLNLEDTTSQSLPASTDLRQWCSPVEDQGALGSCTAHAAAGVIEYYQRKAFKEYIDASRLFIYKTTRDLMGWEGDTGAYLRTTMMALALFGAPPERYWPYTVAKPSKEAAGAAAPPAGGATAPAHFDVEPPAFCYAVGEHFSALDYFRLDPPGTTPDDLLNRIKTYLAGKVPSMFGFAVYTSIGQAGSTGKIPFPSASERVVGGHAIDAVGYDDTMVITNTIDGSNTTGALLIRNSWSKHWGDQGYGWLPYDYVRKSLAVDWWVLLKAAYVDTGEFGL